MNKEPAAWSIDASEVIKGLMDAANAKGTSIAELTALLKRVPHVSVYGPIPGGCPSTCVRCAFEALMDDLDCQEKATAFVQGHYEQAKQRIATLEAMLDEAIGIFSRYLNVPESRDLKDRWEKLKGQ